MYHLDNARMANGRIKRAVSIMRMVAKDDGIWGMAYNCVCRKHMLKTEENFMKSGMKKVSGYWKTACGSVCVDVTLDGSKKMGISEVWSHKAEIKSNLVEIIKRKNL